MKLATLKQGGRDGTLVVVSRDLARCRAVPAIARSLQAALDDWQACEPQLRQVYEALNSGAIERRLFRQEGRRRQQPLAQRRIQTDKVGLPASFPSLRTAILIHQKTSEGRKQECAQPSSLAVRCGQPVLPQHGGEESLCQILGIVRGAACSPGIGI